MDNVKGINILDINIKIPTIMITKDEGDKILEKLESENLTENKIQMFIRFPSIVIPY
jgi:hypothetical protein